MRGVAAGFSAGRGEHPWNPALLIIQVLAKGTASGKWRPSLLWRSLQAPSARLEEELKIFPGLNTKAK